MKVRWKLAIGLLPLPGLLAMVCFLGGGCQTATKQYTFLPVPVELAAPEDPGYQFMYGEAIDSSHRFSPGDVLDIRFSPHGEVPREPFRIRGDGTITLPLIGAIVVAGKTPGELAKEIESRYVPHYFKRLRANIEQRVYYVGGEVRSSGRQVYIGATTVTKAVLSAGDFTDFAAKHRVELTRVGF